jgi:hypothetical protein
MTEQKALHIVDDVVSKIYEKARLLEAENKRLELRNKELEKQLIIPIVGQQREQLNNFGDWFNEHKANKRALNFITREDIEGYIKII